MKTLSLLVLITMLAVVAEAEARAAGAGCKLQIAGAPLERADIQTVERQSPAAPQSAEGVTVWINPFCAASADAGPREIGPVATSGPTELVSGFYFGGGPLYRFSTPACQRPEEAPGAGTIEVVDASGTVVATGTSTNGQFVEIPLPAGAYKIRGTWLGALVNGVHPSETLSVEIPPEHTVRQNFVLDIP